MSLVMPSRTQALRKAQGRLAPFGFLHLLRALKMKNPVVDGLRSRSAGITRTGCECAVLLRVFPMSGCRRTVCRNEPGAGGQHEGGRSGTPSKHVRHKRRRDYVRQLGADTRNVRPAVSTSGRTGSARNSSPSRHSPDTQQFDLSAAALRMPCSTSKSHRSGTGPARGHRRHTAGGPLTQRR